MSTSVLLTSAKEDSEEMKEWVNRQDHQSIDLMHFPLERYVSIEREALEKNIFSQLEMSENIIYGNKRNALFFIKQVEEYNVLNVVKDRINLTNDQPTARLLESKGIPAICTPGKPQPINLIEFMLRLRRFGPTLYPCGAHTKEEIPGLLEELDIPVSEWELYKLKGPVQEKLIEYQNQISGYTPDIVIFHSRKAINRMKAAFPELNVGKCIVISGDKGVSNKLEESGIEVDAEANGSWISIIEALKEKLN